jgi:DNA-binding transcriptional ArsR family regulator
VIKGQDILVLLKLSNEPGEWTVRALGEALGLDPASVHRALGRLEDARLIDAAHRRVNRSNVHEFLLHGLKYAFPPQQGGMSRGVLAAWAAPPLNELLAGVDEPPPVWPHPTGGSRGVALQPLHENAPTVARNDRQIAEQLALLDAIRLGDGRVRSLAAAELGKRLGGPASGSV